MMSRFTIFLLAIVAFVICDSDENSADSGREVNGERDHVDDLNLTSGQEGDLGDVLDSMLHGGERHVHSRQTTETTDADESTGSFNLDVESIIHDGDGHVHDRAPSVEEAAGNGLQYEVKDPDHLLHDVDGDSHLHDLLEEALEGKRPPPGSEPTLFDNPRAEKVTIGTINAEDYVDYKLWKDAKESGGGGGWLDKFTFLSSVFRYDFESFKDRYRLTKEQTLTKHDEG